jgi:LytS/YehU family sensor histidine kinase
MVISWLFDQENITLAYAFNNNFSVKGWFFIILRIVLFNAGILVTKYLYDNSLEQRRILVENEALKREHINAVHESLKQQVDPHFLFNSLNTLQSLVKQDSTQALNFIAELSIVYRYMLLRRDSKYVTVKDEIDFLSSYLYLLTIRFGQAITTQIDVDDRFLNSLIPPHTLQLLAENAVKHNKLSVRNPLKIRIYSEGGYLIVSNNLSEKVNESTGSGVGLSNINSRYKLLFGKKIMIKKEAEFFNVYLPIIDNNERIDN